MTETQQLAAGTYEVLRNRSSRRGVGPAVTACAVERSQGGGLWQHRNGPDRDRTRDYRTQLCASRPGLDRRSTPVRLQRSIRTENRDNALADVFALYDLRGDSSTGQCWSCFATNDSSTIFTRSTVLQRQSSFQGSSREDLCCYMIFRSRQDSRDIKAFKWRVSPNDRIEYVDNRSDHEVRYPPQHDFAGTRPLATSIITGPIHTSPSRTASSSKPSAET